MADKVILVVGTYDTKDDELAYLGSRIASQDGVVLSMDVSVLGDPSRPCDISKHEVAEAAGSSIAEASRRPSGLRKTIRCINSLAHRTTSVPYISLYWCEVC